MQFDHGALDLRKSLGHRGRMRAGNTYRHLWFVWSGKKVQPGSCHLVIFFDFCLLSMSLYLIRSFFAQKGAQAQSHKNRPVSST